MVQRITGALLISGDPPPGRRDPGPADHVVPVRLGMRHVMLRQQF